ncbi:PDC sensor domain-containing protein [Oceanibacterium hippocampi]|uniref:Methyl-accepting chemotaxis protein PctA n=1 Tax=Oceanibacterium hippocampi TaxID=745714 RepID=A0A1Y5S9Z6_9PROT|nr:cache domain-containing protein [Oceanibacterium hippocampi]SLN35906.1 Methyl-accepting chemotaxis protein PctA [Oceanibacterium hippocampi]
MLSRSIVRTIVAVLVGCQLVTLVLVGLWFVHSSRGELRSLARRNVETVIARAVALTDSYLQPAEAAAALSQNLIDRGVPASDNSAALELLFFEQLKNHPQLAGLYLGLADGSFHYVMRDDSKGPGGFRTKSIVIDDTHRRTELVWRRADFQQVEAARDDNDDFDPRTRDWYRKAKSAQGPIWTDPYVFYSSRKPGITAAAPLEGADRKLAGVVGVDIEISKLSQYLRQLSIGFAGTAFIVGPDGGIIAHTQPETVVQVTDDRARPVRFRRSEELAGVGGAVSAEILSRMKQGVIPEQPVLTTFSFEDKTYQLGVARMSRNERPWLLAVLVPEGSVVDAARGSELMLIGVAVISMLITLAFALVLARSLGRPIAQLQRNARRIQRDDFGGVEEVQSHYAQFREVGDAMKHLADSLRRRMPPTGL